MLIMIFLWRLSNGAMTLFFLLAAYVQKNDPDSYFWMTMYSVPAFICFIYFLRITKPDNFLLHKFAQAHVAVCSAVAVYTFSKLSQAVKSYEGQRLHLHEHEEARELGGLLFVICWLLINFKFLRSSTSERKKLSILQLVVAVFPIFLWISAHPTRITSPRFHSTAKLHSRVNLGASNA